MLLEMISQWYGCGFPLHSHSMDEYNLLLEWKRVQHQFYSYFLVLVDRSDEKPCHTNKQTWEWESFVIAMILNSFNSFWINHPPNHRVIYHQNLVLMIYQAYNSIRFSCNFAENKDLEATWPAGLCYPVLGHSRSQSLHRILTGPSVRFPTPE